MSDVRHRTADKASFKAKKENEKKLSNETENISENVKFSGPMEIRPNTFWLTRIVLLRYVAFIYVVAFAVALHQNRALIGKNGLLPADKYLNDINRHAGDSPKRFEYAPTLLWLFDYNNNLDQLLDILAYCGIALAGFVLVSGCANIIIMLSLWALYHSIVNVGQRWYSFGWESQLLETGFLASFLCPLFSLRRLPRNSPTSSIVLFGFKWLLFRIMIGAGLIKIRGDQCWRDLTCMNYHYETQPVPNPLSYFMHQEPEVLHKAETLANHFVELIAPLLIILPVTLARRAVIAGGIIQILFQVMLIVSGNLSFLNWLTILPALACFDDRSLAWLFSSRLRGIKAEVAALQREPQTTRKWGSLVRRCFNISLGLLIAYLSIPVVQNLFSSRQHMNTSFDPLRIVNTYGAFGSVTKERTEIIIQGTYDDAKLKNATWLDFEFKCKPGDVFRRPCLISPYHYRLDWLMWFAAFQHYQQNSWLVNLMAKLLVNDELTTSLLALNPFEGREPPRFIRAEHYRYVFSKWGGRVAGEGQWWKRTRVGVYLPALDLASIRPYVQAAGWTMPVLPNLPLPSEEE